MLKNFLKISSTILLLGVIIFPKISLGADGPVVVPNQQTTTSSSTTVTTEASNLIPCGTERYPIVKDDPKSGLIKNPCGFNDLLTLINNFIKFILFDLAVPIAALMFVYAGFLLITSSGNPHKGEVARTILWKSVQGLALAAAAWLIVELILSILGFDGSWIGF